MRTFIEEQGLWGAVKLMVLVGLASIALAYVGSSVVGAYASNDDRDQALAPADSPGADALGRMRASIDNNAFGVLPEGAGPVTIADYVPEEGRFIGVDLAAGKLTLYEDGYATLTAEVRVQVSADGANALTSGLYMVEAKDERFYSSVSKQYVPSRLQFNDRFSIHGEPERAEGTDTPQDVPGILLSNEDAKRLFDAVPVGTTLFLLAQRVPVGPVGSLTLRKDTMPALSARAYLLRDVVTGHTYLSKNADLRYPIASITKVMTSIVAQEVIGPHTEIAVRSDRYTTGDLYYPLYLRSDNEVANALAQHVGTPAFIARMNTQARAIGMYATRFGDPSGLSPTNVSSAHDLALLAQYLYNSAPVFLDISSTDRMTVTSSEGHAWHLTNQNKLARDPSFVGGKLGFTDEARQTSLALFSMPIEGRTRVVSVIVLGSDDWKQDTRTLLTWFVENARNAPQ